MAYGWFFYQKTEAKTLKLEEKKTGVRNLCSRNNKHSLKNDKMGSSGFYIHVYFLNLPTL